jgi:2-iminobutanoate/2-iminopropanoate deaminase
MAIKRIRGATIVGNIVYTSGMGHREGDVETQIKETLKKLKATLKEAGTDFKHVVKATVYLKDLEDRARYLNKIWGETFGDHRPSRTCIEAGLGSIDVEIELIAALPE